MLHTIVCVHPINIVLCTMFNPHWTPIQHYVEQKKYAIFHRIWTNESHIKLQRNNMKKKKKLYNKYMESLQSLFTWQLTRVFLLLFLLVLSFHSAIWIDPRNFIHPVCIHNHYYYTNVGMETKRTDEKKERKKRFNEFVFTFCEIWSI